MRSLKKCGRRAALLWVVFFFRIDCRGAATLQVCKTHLADVFKYQNVYKTLRSRHSVTWQEPRPERGCSIPATPLLGRNNKNIVALSKSNANVKFKFDLTLVE